MNVVWKFLQKKKLTFFKKYSVSVRSHYMICLSYLPLPNCEEEEEPIDVLGRLNIISYEEISLNVIGEPNREATDRWEGGSKDRERRSMPAWSWVGAALATSPWPPSLRSAPRQVSPSYLFTIYHTLIALYRYSIYITATYNPAIYKSIFYIYMYIYIVNILAASRLRTTATPPCVSCE